MRWGWVWRDFILDDGRVIPEHKILEHPEPPVWRKAEQVTQDEREAWERRLVSMAEAGLDPPDQEQSFWAQLNQYLAYTYLRYWFSSAQNDFSSSPGSNPPSAIETTRLSPPSRL